ncbi:MAG: peptidylprolyl isomerase [Calditrichia bacterium]
MKQFFLLTLLGLLALIACSKKAEVTRLEMGTPEYEFAKSLSEKLPYLDPDSNLILVSSDKFKISSGEFLQNMYANLGKRSEQLLQMDANRVKGIVEQNIQQYGEKILMLTAAKEAGVQVSEAEVDSFLQLNYQRAGGEERFKNYLTSNNISMDVVRNEITNSLKIDKYFKNLYAEKAQVTEEDIQQAYQDDRTATVRHILFSTQGKSDSEKTEIKEKAEKVLARARKGEDFARLAQEFTDDPGSKNNGGLYENFGRGQMVKPFEDASFNLPVGSISDLVETQYGYHIIKVIERKKETRPLDEVRTQLEAEVKRNKEISVYRDEMERLKTEWHYQVHEYGSE